MMKSLLRPLALVLTLVAPAAFATPVDYSFSGFINGAGGGFSSAIGESVAGVASFDLTNATNYDTALANVPGGNFNFDALTGPFAGNTASAPIFRFSSLTFGGVSYADVFAVSDLYVNSTVQTGAGFYTAESTIIDAHTVYTTAAITYSGSADSTGLPDLSQLPFTGSFEIFNGITGDSTVSFHVSTFSRAPSSSPVPAPAGTSLLALGLLALGLSQRKRFAA
jgi:hypothetical protein